DFIEFDQRPRRLCQYLFTSSTNPLVAFLPPPPGSRPIPLAAAGYSQRSIPVYRAASGQGLDQCVLRPFTSMEQDVDRLALVEFGQCLIKILQRQRFHVVDRDDDVTLPQARTGCRPLGAVHTHTAL